MRFQWLVLPLLLIGWPMRLYALDLFPIRESYGLQGELQMLEDPSGNMDFQSVQSAAREEEFQVLEHTNPNFGFSSSVFWFRLVLTNNGPRTESFFLYINNPFLERVEFYARTNGQPVQHRLAGMQSPVRESNPALRLEFDPGSRTELFIRVQSRTPYRIPIELNSRDGEQTANTRRMIVIPFLMGVALFIVIFTAFQWLLIRERSFGYFFALVLLLTGREVMFSGVGLPILKPAHGQMFLILFGMITTLTLILSVLFGSNFLRLAVAMPRVQRFLYIIAALFMLLLPLNLLDPFLVNRLQYYLGVILMLLFLVLAVERAQHGYQPALWLLISQILTLTCTVLFFLLGHGLIEANLLTLNSIRVATIQQIILFSLALTHRLRFTERHYHTKLEDKVNERTNELAELIQVYEVQNDLLLRTTQDLQENEEKFRALAHSAYDAVLLLTNNGLISFWNRAAQQMFGYTADLARNQKFLQLLIPEEDQSELKNRFQQYFRADGIDRTGETFESRANRKDGSIITIEISVSSIQLKSDWLIVAVIRDISKRKREERQLLEAKKTAEEATRAKSEFLATMSHEIRTPLNAVLGFTDLLLKSNPPESQLQYLQIIQSRGIDLLTILNDTLDLSKIEAGKMDMAPMAVNLKELVDDVIRTMLPQAVARNLSLFCEMDADVPEYVLLDPVRVRQILMNLINNALKFTEAGSISVHVDVGHPEMLPDVKNRKEDVCILHIAVSDTGIGISPAKQSIIFDAFAQEDSSTTRRFGGTGLGLSICSSLIQLMRGRIWLQSEPGKGSTFELAVPVDMAATRDALTGLAATGGQNDATDEPVGLRILVVEDEPVNRLLAGKILENMGHHVSEASDGHTALQMIQHNVFDLILMDMEMPGIDGYETSVRIRMLELEKNLARQPILAVTAHSSQETRERCLRAGMDGYLSKPIHIDALRTQMRATLERGQTVHN